MNAADRLRRALLDQRAAILRGDVPETRSMAGVEGLLRKIGREEMPAIQALMRSQIKVFITRPISNRQRQLRQFGGATTRQHHPRHQQQ